MTHSEHGHHHQHHAAQDEPAHLAEHLDLDGVVLSSYWERAGELVRARAGTVERVLDLGAGTGTGTELLARLFPDAELVAVDADESFLHRIRHRVGPRVRTVAADLDAGLPDVDPVDLTWASMSLHHLTTPDAVLAAVVATTRPGGVVAVAEFDEPVRVLPDDLGSGLERRILDAAARQHAADLPELGSDWTSRLRAAGLVDVESQDLDIEVPLTDGDGRRYAELWLRRMRHAVETPTDVAALDELLDGAGPRALAVRDDLVARGVRTLTIGRVTS